MTEDLAARLSTQKSDSRKMSEFEGQTLTVASLEKFASQFQEGRTAVKFTAIDAEGNEVVVQSTPTSAAQLLQVEDILPVELKVEGFVGKGGNKGYRFVTP